MCLYRIAKFILPANSPLTMLTGHLPQEKNMPPFGWIFLLIIIATVIGGLYMLRKTANKMPISEEKMKLIKQRQAELEAQERQREQDR